MIERRDRLLTVWLAHHVNRTIVGNQFEQLVIHARDALPATIEPEVLAASLRYLVGTTPDTKALAMAAWVLTGNLRRLSRRNVVTPWTSQRHLEWVPVQVLDVRSKRSTKGQFGSVFKLQILAGSACPRVVLKWWSHKTAAYLARWLGFTRFRSRSPRAENPHPYLSPVEFTSLRFCVLIDPLRCADGPDFEKIGCPGALLKWNREQLKFRARRTPEYACPFDRPVSLPCFKCRYGYRECRAGTHRSTYVAALCKVCLVVDAWHDPDVPGMCVNCARLHDETKTDGG